MNYPPEELISAIIERIQTQEVQEAIKQWKWVRPRSEIKEKQKRKRGETK